MFLPAADDTEIFPGGQQIYRHVEEREYEIAAGHNKNKQFGIRQAEQEQHLRNHREGECQMDPRRQKRQEENGKHLRIDALPDLRLCHSDFLHDFKAGLVFVAFRNLLIIHDQTAAQINTIPSSVPRKNRPPYSA